jgi:hypothetical protein
MPTDIIPEPTIIELKPEWFKPGYYVYVVVIIYRQWQYYYVGMTGDRKYEVARSPFYRMNGHFNQLESSTQNQILKGLKEKTGGIDIDVVLSETKFTYYCYIIDEYCKDKVELHKEKRIKAEKIESYLIKQLKVHFGKEHVLNKKYSLKNFDDVEIAGERLYANLISKLN